MAEIAERPVSPSPLVSPRMVPATVQVNFSSFESILQGKCKKDLAWPRGDVSVIEVPKKLRAEASNRVCTPLSTFLLTLLVLH